MILCNLYIIFIIFYLFLLSKDVLFKHFGKIKEVKLTTLQQHEINNGIIQYKIEGTTVDSSMTAITIYSTFSQAEIEQIKRSNSFKIQTIEVLNWTSIHKTSENLKTNLITFIVINMLFAIAYVIKYTCKYLPPLIP
jgi:hypothetical protein